MPVASANADPPRDPACLGLIAGSTGLLAVGGSLPTPDTLAGRPGGFGEPVPERLASRLPDSIPFKSNRQTFSEEYAFVLRAGRVYVRPAEVGRADPAQPWRVLELPPCLDGRVKEVTADGRLLLALGPDRQLYAHDMPQGDLSPERWTWRWGPYFWAGSGMRMFGDVADWAASEETSREQFTDSAGREHAPIGVATAYLLRGDERTITYIDPWLAPDDSRQVCGPGRGTRPLAALSGSGSTVFVADERGRLYTRFYDFDVSGANTVFGSYSWEQGRPATDERWQLPAPGWVRQPRPRGTITARISIARTGRTSDDRLLRVEGRSANGRRGWFQKGIAQRRWRFVPAAGRQQGKPLPLAHPSAPAAPDDRLYAGTIAGAPASVLNFNPECSPSTLRVEVAPGESLDLILHSSDGLRQETRASGLDDTPREYNGAIEVPPERLSPEARAWVAANLGGEGFVTAPVAVTETRMRFLAQCWELTLGGAPARPDAARIPPDLGAAVGRFTEMLDDGRGLPSC